MTRLLDRNRPFVLAHPADHYACGRYRVLDPLELLKSHQVADGVYSDYFLPDDVLHDLAPDVVVFQRLLELPQIAAMKRYRRVLGSSVRFVFDIDDLITEINHDNKHSRMFPKQTQARLFEAIGLCDVLVVSTPPLQAAYGHLCPASVVVANALPDLPWSALSFDVVPGLPRVGWAGATGHLGDLRFLADVVRATSHKVNWVFLGAVSEILRRHAAESFPQVPIDQYPYALSRLNLSLAVAPLACNRYNDAKSCLRLLELGSMGSPVVCSDGVGAFDVDLPVFRRPNDSHAWIDFVSSFDFSTAFDLGDDLRAAIRRDWMLSCRVADWSFAWLGELL